MFYPWMQLVDPTCHSSLYSILQTDIFIDTDIDIGTYTYIDALNTFIIYNMEMAISKILHDRNIRDLFKIWKQEYLPNP